MDLDELRNVLEVLKFQGFDAASVAETAGGLALAIGERREDAAGALCALCTCMGSKIAQLTERHKKSDEGWCRGGKFGSARPPRRLRPQDGEPGP